MFILEVELFIVLSSPEALRAASPEKNSLWLSPMSEPAMFWCLHMQYLDGFLHAEHL